MDGVHPDLVIGPSTEIIAGNGMILTAGAHRLPRAPDLPADPRPRRSAAGITTMIGGGTGPAEGTKATTVTPGAVVPGRGCSRRIDAWPVNVVLLGKGNTVSARGAVGAAAGRRGRFQAARGLGHDARRHRRLPARGRRPPGVQAAIHTDTLNEAGFVEDTLRRDRRPADPRVPHRGRGRRARAGHHHRSPRAPNVLPSSTNPTRPHTVNTARRAPRHADGLPPPQPGGPRGPGVRREPDPAVDDRGRGRPARPRRDLDDRLGLPGDGPDRRGGHAHLADRARDEAAARRAARATVGDADNDAGPRATSPSTRSARRSRTAWTARSARSSPASWPTWCCGTPRSSACGRTW